ncbi:metallo-protease, partial [Rhizoctonia solani]
MEARSRNSPSWRKNRPRGDLDHCMTFKRRSYEQVKIDEASFQEKKNLSKAKQSALNLNVVIPVHWHAIQSGDSLAEGHIPESQVIDSIKVLNEDYATTGFSFKLESANYVTNATWFEAAGPDTDYPERVYQTEMKGKLHQGNATTLNIYTVGFTNISDPRLLGYATFPKSYIMDPLDDGVVILYSTVPGGSSDPNNLGRTLTHEVGHWMNLYHTFSESCDDDGDFVDDTPAQLNSTKGCPTVAPDSCPGRPGRDPIHNYMDYSSDICLTEFTPGQIRRMQESFLSLRIDSA